MKVKLNLAKRLSLPFLIFITISLQGFSQSLSFNGTNQYVTSGVTPSNSILNTPTFTVETWFKRTGTGIPITTGSGGIPAAIPLITKGTSEGETPAADINYFLGINTVGNVLCADFEEGASSASPSLNHPISGITTIVNGTWYHAAATYDGNKWQLFLNGNLEAELVVGRTANAAVISPFAMATSIRSDGTTIQGYFNGVLDEPRIWNFARTHLQIQTSINSELTSGTGLLGRWGLNDGSGTSAANSIAGSPAGTLVNSPTWTSPGAPFNITFTIPATPSGLTATASSAYQINLSWTDNSTTEAAFEIERSTAGAGGPFTLLATTGANTTSYNDNICLSPSTQYWYRVRAANGGGSSAYTSVADATTPAEGNYGLDLGASGAYVTFGKAMGLSTQNFTVETWFKKTGAGTANTTGTGGIDIIPILTKGSPEAENSNVDANYILGIQSLTNKIAADFEEGTGSVSPGLNHPLVGTTTITDNVWHHAAITFQNGVYSIYLDGILEASSNPGAAIWPQGASIQHAALGTMINSTGAVVGKFQGLIDEARIWNNGRTESQIRASINDQITTAQSGLLARWGLNEGTGTVINSSACTAFTGTITGTGSGWVTPGAPFNLSFIPPNAPSSLVVTALSTTALQLNWTDNSTDETGFEIERSTTGSGGPFTLLTTVAANVVTYNNTGLTAATNYCYRIRAIKSGLFSNYTSIACSSTLSGPVTRIFQDGLNGYTGTRDTYIYDINPATVRGSEITFVQDKNPANIPPDNRTSLLRFDLSSIPAGSTIQSAELQFFVDAEGQGFNMHPMLVPWDETTASFASIGNRHFAADNIDAQAVVNANWPGVDTYVGLITVAVPASTIQDWINGTLTNNGWLMIATHADDGQQLRSREYTTQADRPKLTVIYANQPPNQPTNPSPADNGTATSTSPTLCATVSDPNSNNLTVRFYGRKKVTSNTKFTIIGLPDTQFYTEEVQGTNSGGGGHNGIFKAQTQWIKDHRVDSSIAFVVQLGDCVQNGDNPPGADKQIEWKRADTSMKIIESPSVPITDGIPYGICVGNHDQGTIGNPDGATLYYNQYFGESRFNGRSYYGGHYGTNNDNHYELFSAGGIDFIHISIEYYPNGTTASLQPVLDWADALLKTFSNRKAILSTHNMLGTGNPASFQGPGQKIYDDLKDNPNLFLMLAGHVAGEGRRSDVFNGNTIHTIMADYQSGYSNGGNGILRIMQFLPGQNLMKIKTYSPYSNSSQTGAGSEFSLPVNLLPGFTLIGTNTNVSSGTSTCKLWPGLETNTMYEWYVEISDGDNITTGPIWTFTLGSGGPLPITLLDFSAKAENKKVKLQWSTANEIDNSYFQVQRSADGINFTSIGSEPGRGNSTSTQYYFFMDLQPLYGVSYYRLKQVDKDGKFVYSKIVSVHLTKSGNKITVFPNPVKNNQYTISLTNDNNSPVEVQVYGTDGKLFFRKLYPGTNSINIINQLNPGTYILKVITNNNFETQKLIIK